MITKVQEHTLVNSPRLKRLVANRNKTRHAVYIICNSGSVRVWAPGTPSYKVVAGQTLELLDYRGELWAKGDGRVVITEVCDA